MAPATRSTTRSSTRATRAAPPQAKGKGRKVKKTAPKKLPKVSKKNVGRAQKAFQKAEKVTTMLSPAGIKFILNTKKVLRECGITLEHVEAGLIKGMTKSKLIRYQMVEGSRFLQVRLN